MMNWGCSWWFVFDISQYVQACARNTCAFVTHLLRKIRSIWVICAPPPKTAYFAIPRIVWSAVLVRWCSVLSLKQQMARSATKVSAHVCRYLFSQVFFRQISISPIANQNKKSLTNEWPTRVDYIVSKLVLCIT